MSPRLFSGGEKDEINVPIALSAFRDGDQGPSKVTKTKDEINVPIALSAFRDGDRGPSKVTKTQRSVFSK